MHSVTTLSIDFDSTCSNRFGNELNVESVPLNLATTIRGQREGFSRSVRKSRTGAEGGSVPMNENDD